MLKKAYPIGKPGFPKRKTKVVAMFFVSKWQNGGYPTPKSLPGKVREKSGEIEYHTKNRQSVPSSPIVYVGLKIVRLLYLFSSVDLHFLSFRCIESFIFCSTPESDCLNFKLMTFL